MSWNSLRDIQYSNMFKMVNRFLYQYCCDMEMRIYREDKVVYERDSENRRKRKIVSEKHEELKCLMINGNGSEYICSVIQNKNKEFEVYTDCYPWSKDATPTCICGNSEIAENAVEEICRKHYFEKHGCEQAAYSHFGKTRKRLSVQEICDWYNQFRKLDMSVSEVESTLYRLKEELKEAKKENERYEKLLLGVAKKKGLI